MPSPKLARRPDNVTTMSQLTNASTPVRDDVVHIEDEFVRQLAAPGASLTGGRRVSVARAARLGSGEGALQEFAHHLYSNPATVTEHHVRTVADEVGDPQVVETVGIVARLSAIDRVHQVVGVGLEPLPDPLPGEPTGDVAEDLKRRRCHLPMPPGPIPLALDLLPGEGRSWQEMFGPLYMTEEEMGDPTFHRSPGLDTPQLETVAARISLLNECFY